MAKEIKDYSVSELLELIEQKKQSEISGIKDKLKAARGIVTELEAQLEKLTGKVTKATRGTRSQGGPSAKEAILEVLKKGPASSRTIIDASGLKAGSINQGLVALKKAKTIKHDGTRGGNYSLK